jgi:hypothetical protein
LNATIFIFDKFKNYIIQNNSKNTNNKITNIYDIRKLYDDMYVKINIKSAIEYVYSQYNNNKLKNDIHNNTYQKIQKDIEVKIVNRKHGEGEKILIDMLYDDYKEYGDKKSYTFYSPDGDSVILCLNTYVQLKIERLTVIKTYLLNPSKDHNNQSQYIDIKDMYDNIISIIENYCKTINNNKNNNIR